MFKRFDYLYGSLRRYNFMFYVFSEITALVSALIVAVLMGGIIYNSIKINLFTMTITISFILISVLSRAISDILKSKWLK